MVPGWATAVGAPIIADTATLRQPPPTVKLLVRDLVARIARLFLLLESEKLAAKPVFCQGRKQRMS